MKDSTPSLVLYAIASILVIIAKVFGFELLMLAVKPMVVPAIYYYYLQTRTTRVNLWFSIAIWLFFIADMLMLILGQSGILWIMGCGIASYLIMVLFAVQDTRQVRPSVFNIAFVIALITLLCYLLVTILSLNMEPINENYIFYTIYGVVLIMLVTVCTFNYLNFTTQNFLNLCLMSLCMLLSDLFYSLNRFVVPLPILDHINLFAQFMSYYFMVSYFNTRHLAHQNSH